MSNLERVRNALTNFVVSRNSWGLDEISALFENTLYLKDTKPVVVNGETFYLVDSRFSPPEGSKMGVWMVFHLEGDDTLYRVTGSYDSWDGHIWDDASLKEVVKYPIITYRYKVKTED